MRERSSTSHKGQPERSAASAAAWMWWGPAMAVGAEWNTKWRESCVALSGERQDFVSRRAKEDLELLRSVASAQTPEAAWSAYAKFWQKAAEDYTHQYAAMARLAGDFVSSGMTAAQHTLEEAAATTPAASKAA